MSIKRLFFLLDNDFFAALDVEAGGEGFYLGGCCVVEDFDALEVVDVAVSGCGVGADCFNA